MKALKLHSLYRWSMALAGSLIAPGALATIVQFQTSLGDFEVNLYDDTTPQTVENFLMYMEAGAYERAIIHRLARDFVVQGGGFRLNQEDMVEPVSTPWSPLNEPVYANVRGTIAMAKRAGDVNSATSQWFINLGDNRLKLDNQNGGFTVFGQVIGDGMQVVDAIAALNEYHVAGAFDEYDWKFAFVETPMQIAPDPDKDVFLQSISDYLVLVDNIVVIDASTDTAADLQLQLTTRDETPPAPKRKKKSGALGGELLLGLLALGLLVRKRRR